MMEASELLKGAKLIPHNGCHLIDTDTILGLLEEFSKNEPKSCYRMYTLGWGDAAGEAVDVIRMCFKYMAENNQFELTAVPMSESKNEPS